MIITVPLKTPDEIKEIILWCIENNFEFLPGCSYSNEEPLAYLMNYGRTDRPTANTSGLKVTNFHFKYYTPEQETFFKLRWG